MTSNIGFSDDDAPLDEDDTIFPESQGRIEAVRLCMSFMTYGPRSWAFGLALVALHPAYHPPPLSGGLQHPIKCRNTEVSSRTDCVTTFETGYAVSGD